MKYLKIILASLVLLSFTQPKTHTSSLTILGGSKNSTPYRFVHDIETIVGPTVDFKIINPETNGAAYNLEQLADPKSPYKMAIIQADFLYYMQGLDMRLNTVKTKYLKVLLPLDHQQIHLVTRESKGYKGLKDMAGKTVAIGSNEQGTYRTATLIKERSNIMWTSKNVHFDYSLRELNRGNIDAFFVVSSAPIGKLDLNPQSMVDKLALIPLEDFNDWAKYYKPDTIHKGEYKWLDHDVPTFSVPSLLVVNENKLSETDRKNVVKLKTAIEAKQEELKTKGHPKWKQVNLTDWKESDWPLFK